ncbi:hypothetical protein JUNP353_1471 [Elizabethkingia anophelis]|nr:hypothetical protein JUNP353_1471 [Elizabethkingia anophelis]
MRRIYFIYVYYFLKLEKNFFVATVNKKTPHSFECGVSIITAKYARYHTLISTSTPLGSSNFIRASTVLEEEE